MFPVPDSPSRPFRAVFGLLVLLVAVVLAPAIAATSTEPPPPVGESPRRVLTVSAATDNYPYSFRDESGRLTGYGVEMLDAVAEVMHVRLERTEVTAIEDIANLESGRFDIGQFHATVPPEEHPAAAYSQPILVNHGDVFVRKGDHRFRSLEDLRTQKARIAAAQQGREFLVARGFAPALIELSTSTGALRELSAGRVDAVLLTRLTGLSQAHINGFTSIEPLGLFLPDFKVTFGIATRPRDRELRLEIDEALATLSTTGRTVEIYSRWFGRYESRGLSLRQLLLPATAALGVALLAALVLLRRQHRLARRIVSQSEELRVGREILAEAQRFAQLGHSRREPGTPAVWSDETYRIFERNPTDGVPSFDELLSLAIPADRARWQEAITAVQRGGPPYDFDITIEPSPGRRKIVNVRGRPTFDSAGHLRGSFGTVQDVTASRTAAAALQRSELLLRALYENLPLALGLVERQADGWHVLSLNPEALHQLDVTPLPPGGAPLGAIGLPPDRVAFWQTQFDRCTLRGQTAHLEFEQADLRRHFSASVVPLILPGQQPRCCLLSENVTNRRLKDAELAQSRRLRAIGELVGGIAHEFNNLITPIALNTEMLFGQCADRPDMQDELRTVADAARRAGDLTRRLLAFGRRTDGAHEAVDLAAVATANIDLVRHTFDRRIALVANLSDDLPVVRLHGGDLHQIILNLLLNARDALTEKLAHPPAPDWQPRIEVTATRLAANELTPAAPSPSARAATGWVRLTVRDNGCGMPPAVRERLFEPFFTTKGVGHGTGLGLATIWHLTTEFGGRIDVDSTPGEGSAFHLGLPLFDPPPAPQVSAPAVAQPSRPALAPGRHFLVADDEGSVARVVTRVLERGGHRITTVADGLEAWTRLSADPAAFDAVVADLNMPGLTGKELVRKARALPYARPVIVMSGRISEIEREELEQSGVDALLAKPFTISAFGEAVARAFAKRDGNGSAQ